MFKTITPAQLHSMSSTNYVGTKSIIVNVCTPAEYAEEHIADSLNIPLDQLPQRLEELKPYQNIYVHCRSGKRSEVASKILIQKLKSQIFNVQGGLMEWKAKGFSTITNTKRVPIMRQVFIAASLLLWLGLLGFYVVGAWGLLLVAIVASGLLISGVTGWCGMAFLLAKMPWNRL